MTAKIIGTPLPNIPWEDKPEGCRDMVWRYSRNPIIPRDLLPTSNSIFNSAVVPFEGEFAGVFRCDDWVMGRRGAWESTKIGAGPVPIETTEGWLLIYHGVLTSCNGYVYHAGAAILDIDEPWKVRYRAEPYILNPRELYECVGDVPNVTFPCAALADSETGRIAIYYGAADTVTALAFAKVDELVDWIKANSRV